MGNADGCLACKRIKGSLRKIYAKKDPFGNILPGYWFVGDIVTFDEPSRFGHRYAFICRDVATGWYFPLLWLDLRSDFTVQFEAAVTKLRRSGLFRELGYPLMQRLRLDNAGEWGKDCKPFREMMARLGIEPEYSSPQDKRSSAHQEAAVKHLCVPAKATL